MALQPSTVMTIRAKRSDARDNLNAPAADEAFCFVFLVNSALTSFHII